MNDFDLIEGDEDSGEEWVSKSQRKRDDEALQQLAGKLVELPVEQFLELGLEEDLQEAVDVARKLGNKRGALKRQIKYVTGLLRIRDNSSIYSQLEAFDSRNAIATAHLHRLEAWRERLIDEGDGALSELLQEYPRLDRQQVRQLSRKAKEERHSNKPPKAFRQLFQLLKQTSESEEQEF